MEHNRLLNEVPERFSLCVRVQEQLQDFMEGYLDAVATEAVRAHLAVCILCSRNYRELRQTIRIVESLPFMEPGRDYTAAVRAAIQPRPGMPWWKWRVPARWG
jgi:anti-sigma factor RsiW